MINKDGGGGIFRFCGGDTAVMRVPPIEKTLQGMRFQSPLFSKIPFMHISLTKLWYHVICLVCLAVTNQIVFNRWDSKSTSNFECEIDKTRQDKLWSPVFVHGFQIGNL